MAVQICSHCQAELPEGTEICDNCGIPVPKNQPVSGVPAMAGAALFAFVLLACEWFHFIWPAVFVGVALLAFLILRYGKLAYVPPTPAPAKIEAEVPVGELLEKVEVSQVEPNPGPSCPHCGAEVVGAGKFCGNCGQPLQKK